MIPQFCGTGPFGSDIKITIASKINVKFLKSATAEHEKKIKNLPIGARACKSRAAAAAENLRGLWRPQRLKKRPLAGPLKLIE
jgi:hypothetical protein